MIRVIKCLDKENFNKVLYIQIFTILVALLSSLSAILIAPFVLIMSDSDIQINNVFFQKVLNIYLSAHKVLKKDGHIIIFDFFSKKIKKVIYKHDRRILSIKQDFRKIFRKNNKYKCIYHNVFNYFKMFKVKNYKKNDLLSISVMKNKNYKND